MAKRKLLENEQAQLSRKIIDPSKLFRRCAPASFHPQFFRWFYPFMLTDEPSCFPYGWKRKAAIIMVKIYLHWRYFHLLLIFEIWSWQNLHIFRSNIFISARICDNLSDLLLVRLANWMFWTSYERWPAFHLITFCPKAIWFVEKNSWYRWYIRWKLKTTLIVVCGSLVKRGETVTCDISRVFN